MSALVKRFFDGERGSLADFFVSERVDAEIAEPKVLLGSFNKDEILTNIPFSSRVYVQVCPKCVTKKNLSKYKILVERSAIVPVLIAPYRAYPEDVFDISIAHDHVSRYEFYSYRSIMIGSLHHGGLCSHCAQRFEDDIVVQLSKDTAFSLKGRDIKRVMMNLAPFVRPDFQLLENLRDAVANHDALQAVEIVEISETISQIRSAEALDAPLILNADKYRLLPTGVSESFDLAAATAEAARHQIAEGVGLTIPLNIPLETYLEVASEYRPKICEITDKIGRGDTSRSVDGLRVQREIMKLNGEIERVKSSPENILLEAGIEFYQDNSLAINAVLTASAMSLVHGAGWLGCVAGGATSAAASGLRKIGKLKAGPSVEKFYRLVERQVQPAVDALVSKYVGASQTSVRIMSLQRSLERAAHKKQQSPTRTRTPRKPKTASKS